MTIVRKFLANLEEIKAVVFECNECKARIVLAPDINQPPAKCPLGHSWDWDGFAGHQPVAYSPYVLFLLGLKKLREPVKGKNDFTIYLEFDEAK